MSLDGRDVSLTIEKKNSLFATGNLLLAEQGSVSTDFRTFYAFVRPAYATSIDEHHNPLHFITISFCSI